MARLARMARFSKEIQRNSRRIQEAKIPMPKVLGQMLLISPAFPPYFIHSRVGSKQIFEKSKIEEGFQAIFHVVYGTNPVLLYG